MSTAVEFSAPDVFMEKAAVLMADIGASARRGPKLEGVMTERSISYGVVARELDRARPPLQDALSDRTGETEGAA